MLVFQMFHIKHHRNAEPCRTGLWGWQIANASEYLIKCGICCQPYIPTFITFSREKGGKRLYTSSFWGNSDVRKSLFPLTPLFSYGLSVIMLTMSAQACRDSLSPFPATAAQGAHPRLRIIPGRSLRKRQACEGKKYFSLELIIHSVKKLQCQMDL